MCWEDLLLLSHWSNFSAGVAILFSDRLRATLTLSIELERGQVLMEQAEIRGTGFLFVNVYVSNIGE